MPDISRKPEVLLFDLGFNNKMGILWGELTDD